MPELLSSRSDSSSSVLLGMKSVVIACKAVTEDVEDYEHDIPEDDGFADLKQELSSGLTQLMTAAKVHSNAFNEDEEEFERTLTELESAADQLEAIVMDIVNVPKHGGGNKAGNSNGHNNANVNSNSGNPYHEDNHMDRDHHHGEDSKGHQDSMDFGNTDEPMEASQLKVRFYPERNLVSVKGNAGARVPMRPKMAQFGSHLSSFCVYVLYEIDLSRNPNWFNRVFDPETDWIFENFIGCGRDFGCLGQDYKGGGPGDSYDSLDVGDARGCVLTPGGRIEITG